MSSEYTPVEEVKSIVSRVVHHIDAKRWEELRALYAAEVDVDYSSLFGGGPKKQAAAELIEGWEQSLSKVKTQHLLGPIDVVLEGDSARAECHVRANHYLAGSAGENEWIVLGHYLFRLLRLPEGWRIDSMKLELFHQLGNLKLLDQAKQ